MMTMNEENHNKKQDSLMEGQPSSMVIEKLHYKLYADSTSGKPRWAILRLIQVISPMPSNQNIFPLRVD